MPAADSEFAPAKVNLTLRVTGRRGDGYHLLDSLVVFPRTGDRIETAPGLGPSLKLDGPFGENLGNGADNLVLRAARLYGTAAIPALKLTKNLPIASGIGGGSADAAAALRLLARVLNKPLPSAEQILSLGADVPVCVRSRPARMSGIGEQLRDITLPAFWILLVNPGISVATGQVFTRLESRDNPPMGQIPDFGNAAALFTFLQNQRNDLESPARSLEPVIDQTLTAISQQPGCALARMSGSGATCFGLFETEAQANTAATAISAAQPAWWVQAAPVS